MTAPADRFKNWIDELGKLWSQRLGEWFGTFLAWGIDKFVSIISKAMAPKLKPIIDELEASPDLPDWLKPILREIAEPKGQIAAMLGWSASGAIFGGAIGAITDAMFLRFAYWMNEKFHPRLPNETQMIAYLLRFPEIEEKVDGWLKKLGADDDTRAVLKELSKIRLDPATITAIWRRDKAKWEHLWKDLADSGVNPERIEVFQELAKIIPPLSDMVRFADFSAFDPEVIEKWREFYDAPGWIREPFSLLGVEKDWADKYWFSHWVQPGRFELSELHRRGEIDDNTVKLAYRTMGYSPFWQEYLLKLVRAVPTRVDVRRWWDMRTIDEARLREIYHAQGYYDKDLDDYVLWTKVYVAFPDLIARFKNGWLTEDDVRGELVALGMPAERVEEMIQTKIKQAKPERVAKDRDLTKTDIYRGVKKGIISEGEGIELLQDLGYDRDEAEYIIKINVAAAEGSPETYSEFKQITQLYRKAQGLSAKLLPPELVEANSALAQAEADLTRAKGEELKEEKLVPYQKAVDDAAYRYRQLLIKWQETGK